MEITESNELVRNCKASVSPGCYKLHLPFSFRYAIFSSLVLIASPDPKHDAVIVIGRFQSTKLTAKEKLPSPTSSTLSPTKNVSGCIF